MIPCIDYCVTNIKVFALIGIELSVTYILCTGTAVLVLASTEASLESYYGDQGLHYIDVRGESCLVPRGVTLFSYPLILKQTKWF